MNKIFKLLLILFILNINHEVLAASDVTVKRQHVMLKKHKLRTDNRPCLALWLKGLYCSKYQR